MKKINPIGTGMFGPIYDQFYHQGKKKAHK